MKQKIIISIPERDINLFVIHEFVYITIKGMMPSSTHSLISGCSLAIQKHAAQLFRTRAASDNGVHLRNATSTYCYWSNSLLQFLNQKIMFAKNSLLRTENKYTKSDHCCFSQPIQTLIRKKERIFQKLINTCRVICAVATNKKSIFPKPVSYGGCKNKQLCL